MAKEYNLHNKEHLQKLQEYNYTEDTETTPPKALREENIWSRVARGVTLVVAAVMIILSLFEIEFFQVLLEIFKEDFSLVDNIGKFIFFPILLTYLILVIVLLASMTPENIKATLMIIPEKLNIKEYFDQLFKKRDNSTLGVAPGVIRIMLIFTVSILMIYTSVKVDTQSELVSDSLAVSFVFMAVYFGISEESLNPYIKSPRKIKDPSPKNIANSFKPVGDIFNKLDSEITSLLDKLIQTFVEFRDLLEKSLGEFDTKRTEVMTTLTTIKDKLIVNQEKIQKIVEEDVLSAKVSKTRKITDIITLLIIAGIYVLFRDSLISSLFMGILLTIFGLHIGKIITKYFVEGRNKRPSLLALKMDLINEVDSYTKELDRIGTRLTTLKNKQIEEINKIISELETRKSSYTSFVTEYNLLERFPPTYFALALVLIISVSFITFFGVIESINPETLGLSIKDFVFFVELCISAYFVRQKA